MWFSNHHSTDTLHSWFSPGKRKKQPSPKVHYRHGHTFRSTAVAALLRLFSQLSPSASRRVQDMLAVEGTRQTEPSTLSQEPLHSESSSSLRSQGSSCSMSGTRQQQGHRPGEMELFVSLLLICRQAAHATGPSKHLCFDTLPCHWWKYALPRPTLCRCRPTLEQPPNQADLQRDVPENVKNIELEVPACTKIDPRLSMTLMLTLCLSLPRNCLCLTVRAAKPPRPLGPPPPHILEQQRRRREMMAHQKAQQQPAPNAGDGYGFAGGGGGGGGGGGRREGGESPVRSMTGVWAHRNRYLHGQER